MNQDFAAQIFSTGSVTVKNVFSAEFVARARTALSAAIERESEYHRSRSYRDFGMVLLCPLYDRVFIDVLEHTSFISHFNAVMGNGCIIYAYTSSSMPPNSGNYSTRIHVDCPRLIPNYITNMGATILLDDFTEENGATWFLPNSHGRLEPPSREEFFAHGQRLIAPAGSVWFFNARTWHAGGQNRTGCWRHALTLNICRPYMKQRIDIPRALDLAGVDMSGVTDRALQKLGFLSQVPANYDEYYAPLELRKYKQPVE